MSGLPSGETAVLDEAPMYKHLLIATDGSKLAQNAVDQGLELAKTLDAKATIITVTEPLDLFMVPEVAVVTPPDYEERLADNAMKVLLDANKAAEKIGASCTTLYVKNRFPGEGIVETAKENGCDLIVMASHGRRGLPRLLLGSVANEVVTHSNIPVLICR
jgi:nucleotide-binding universal stress UspA family protein